MNPQTPTLSRAMSPVDFAAYGAQEIAYVKKVVAEGEQLYSIHGADGTPLAVQPDRDLAFAIVRQNDLEPVSVH